MSLLGVLSPNKNYTDMQKAFLEALSGEARGNIKEALNIAGYAIKPYQIVAYLKEEIIKVAEVMLASHGPMAAVSLGDILDDKAAAPGADKKIAAAKEVLDRIGIIKREKIDLTVQAPSGIFILPSKEVREAIVPNET